MATLKDKFINIVSGLGKSMTSTPKLSLKNGFFETPQKITNTPSTVNQSFQKDFVTTNSATSPVPTKITPPVTQNTYSSTPKENFINKISSSNSILPTQQTSTIQNTQVSTPQIETPKNPQNAYLEYLRGQFNPQKLEELSTTKNNELNRLNEIQSRNKKAELDAIAEQERTRVAAGGLKSGTDQAIGQIGRKANLESAYGALEENTALNRAKIAEDAYQNAINAGKTVFEAEQASLKAKEGFSLGKDQTRYEYNSNTGQYEKIGGGTTTTQSGVYTPGIDTTADAWVKYVQNGGKITDVPDEYQNAVAQGTTTQAKPQSEISKTVSSVIDELLLNPGLSRISGPVDQLLGGAFGDAALAKNKYNQLKGLLSLDNIKYLKGTGAISDAEQRLLANAASAIGRNLSDADFRKELVKLKEGLNAVQDNVLADDEIEYLKSKGYTDEQIKSSFSNVGKTTASNIPQKNKNPGNIKKGGIADKLAIGVDNQGHLIFPDEQTGFNAMKLDIQAKINGQSKYLPPNPTIEQLGKIYAEDPNWGKKVASILAVSPKTNTKMIPINNLVQAIARQEGYYA